MENKSYYIISILKTLGIAAIGLLIAELFGDEFLVNDSVLLTGLLFAGLPFGWVALRQIFGGFLVWGFWGIFIYYLILFIFSMVIGWMILLFRLAKDIVFLIIAVCTEKRAGVR